MKQKSIDRALDFLKHNLNTGTWKTGDRLPNAKQLAALAEVSYMSMLTALTSLKTKKEVAYKERVGIYAGEHIPKLVQKHAPAPVQRPPQKKRPEKIKEALYKDITIGKFYNDPYLPSVKELSSLYHADFTVIKKALDVLVEDGIVCLERKRYRIVRHLKTTSASIISLFIHENYSTNSNWHFERDWCNIFIRTLESACYDRSIRLIKIWYGGNQKFSSDIKNTLGSIIYHSPTVLQPFKENSVTEIVAHVQKFSKPVVLISGNMEVLDTSIFTVFKKHAQGTQFFIPSQNVNKEAGKKVGQMLISRGHRKVCFFVPSDNPLFTERFQGLRDSFTSAGLPDAVSYFIPNQEAVNNLVNYKSDSPISLTVMIDQLKADLKRGHSAIQNMSSSKKVSRLTAELHTMLQELSALNGAAQALEVPLPTSINDILESLVTVYKTRLPVVFKNPLVNIVQEIHNSVMLQRTFFPVYEQALAVQKVTAWVCAEDHLTNAAALEFCKSRSIKIPEQLGLIGFQDHFESCTNNISSYHFDFAKTALKALSLVTHPKHSAKLFCKKDSGEFAFEGMVIDRGST